MCRHLLSNAFRISFSSSSFRVMDHSIELECAGSSYKETAATGPVIELSGVLGAVLDLVLPFLELVGSSTILAGGLWLSSCLGTC